MTGAGMAFQERRPTAAVLAAMAITVGFTASGCDSGGRAAPSPSAPPSWAQADPANPGWAQAVPSRRSWRLTHMFDYGDFDAMEGAILFGPADGWAFGETNSLDEGEVFPIALRWNGRSWRQVNVLPRLQGVISSMSASAPDDIWVTVHGDVDTYVLRYDGHRWSQVRAPAAEIFAVRTLGRRGVWLMGNDVGKPTNAWLSETAARSGGGPWRKTRLPVGYLRWVAPVSGPGMWAYGGNRVARLDGAKWREVSTDGALPPDDETRTYTITSMLALADDDVWLFGERGETNEPYPLAAHWNGRRWERVAVPAGRRFGQACVDSRGRIHVIASPMLFDSPESAVVLSRYPDGRWEVSTIPVPQGTAARLRGLAVVPGTDEVMVFGEVEIAGERNNGNGYTSSSVIYISAGGDGAAGPPR
ncbi:hypothetical protein Mth01_42010 [Sphaerimonospora thailandensis]|uniref:Uncharacterized protein n=2 Tax=Sphaerimonospora thailandensis TaxID=795644 RepID=A0A8J3RBF6_9ACTN|nr:hypothetical protein Mth01_42010 [Sphaerimonospora thailandensis]